MAALAEIGALRAAIRRESDRLNALPADPSGKIGEALCHLQDAEIALFKGARSLRSELARMPAAEPPTTPTEEQRS